MRIFIAGIMQGSRTDEGIVAQNYRQEITQILRDHVPGVEVVDPIALHPDSVGYSPERAKQTLVELAEEAGRVNALVAYVPAASMGTAIEMWRAYQGNVPVYTISPLTSNWVVRSLSTQVFPDIAVFREFVVDGGLSGTGHPSA
jgi:hypothetical protein